MLKHAPNNYFPQTACSNKRQNIQSSLITPILSGWLIANNRAQVDLSFL